MFFGKKISFGAISLISILAGFLFFPGQAFAAYETSGVLTSANFLPTEGTSLINSFRYTVSSLPAGTSLKIQFSYDGNKRIWYSADGTVNGWTDLSAGANTIDLSARDWQASYFYYRLWFTSDGADTPVITDVSLAFNSFDGTFYTYSGSGVLLSANLLSSVNASAVNSFSYTVSSLPAETGLTLQFSPDNNSWYNSAGTLDGADTLTAGTHTLSLAGLGWTGSSFYYKANFTSDGANTPVLDDISLSYDSPNNYYWVGGTGNWSDAAHWAATSGGAGDLIGTPSATDNVVFDASSGGGTVTLTADAAAYTLSISAGTLNLQTYNLAVSGAVQITGGTISGTTGVLTGGSYDAQAGTISAKLGGTGSVLTKTTAGSLTLSGDNIAMTGGVTLTAGTLNINSATALGTGTFTINGGTISNTSATDPLTLTTNNVQAWNGDFTFNGMKSLNLGTGAVTLGGNITASVSGDNELTIGGAIGDGGNGYSLTKTGTYAGRLSLTGNNTYTGLTTLTVSSGDSGSLLLSGDNIAASGGVTLTTGTLYINSATALGTGTFTISSGAIANTSAGAITLSTNNVQAWNGSFSFQSNQSLNLGTGAVTLGGNLTINLRGDGSLTVGGVIGDGGNGYGITRTTTYNGPLILSGANTYSGQTIITSGVIKLNNALAAQNSTVTVSATNGLTFGPSIGTFTIGGLAGASNFALTDTGSVAVTLQAGQNNADTTYSGVMSGTGGAFTKQGSGTLTMSAAKTYTGLTTVSAGVLTLSTGGNLNSLTISPGATVSLGSGQTFTVPGTFTAEGTSGSPITLNATTPTSQALLNITTVGTVSYVNATDINSSGGSAVAETGGGTLSNTLNWTLPDSTPSAPSAFSPANNSAITDSTPTITFTTDENADCYASTTDASYDAMASDTNCTGDGTTSQSCTLPDLGAVGTKTVYLACQDTAGNKDTIATNEALTYELITTSGTARYWIDTDGGNWNDTANWSTTSGGAGGSSVPVSTSDAIFDGNGAGDCTINATVDVKGMYLAGYTGTISQGSNAMTIGADGYRQTSGTFTGSGTGSDINFNGKYFTISGGTFNSTNGSLILIEWGSNNNDSTFTVSGGNFNAGSGTVNIGNGINTTNLYTINADGVEFNNLTIDNVYNFWNDVVITAGTSITVNGTLTLTDGPLWTGTINAKGSVVQNSGFDGGNAIINLNGTGAQTYTINGGSAPHIVFNNSNLYVTPGADCNFTSLTLTAGTLNGGSNTIYLFADGGDNGYNGSFVINGGTFNANTGTVSLTSGSPTHYTVNANGAVFNNLTINESYGSGTWGSITITAGTAITVNGTLTLTDSQISGGTINAKGTVSVGSLWDGGTVALTMSSTTADQTLTIASGGIMPSGTLTINKAGYTAYISGVTSATAPLHNIALTAGTLTFQPGTYYIDDADSITTSADTALNFAGTGSGAGLVTLRSDTTAVWDLVKNASATITASWTDVQYSNASAAIFATHLTNSGNNTNWNSDDTAPVVSDNAPASWQTANFIVTLTCSDDSGSGCSKVYYTLDGTAPTTESAFVNTASSWQFTEATEGDYVLKYRGLDVAGNLADTVTATNHLRLDKAAPTVTDDVPSGWQNDDITVTLTCNDPVGGGSGCSQIFYTLDGADPDVDSPLFVNVVGSWQFTFATTTREEAVLKYRGLDTAGNLATVVTAENSLQIDKVAPVISNLNPASGATITASGQSVTFTLNKTGDCRAATTAKSYDGMSGDTACSVANGIQQTCALPTLSSGTQTIYFACQDYLGNKDTALSATSVSYVVPAVAVETTRSSSGGSAAPSLSASLAVQVDNGATTVKDSRLTLELAGRSDSTAVIISTSPDFADALVLPYVPGTTASAHVDYNVCRTTSKCPDGNYTVYVKFLDKNGLSTPAVSTQVYVQTSSLSDRARALTEDLRQKASALAKLLESAKEPEAEISFPPISIAVPETAQPVFARQWDKWGVVLPENKQLFSAPLPKDFMAIANKFPEVAQALKKVGIVNLNGAGQLETARISLPSLGETAGLDMPEVVAVKLSDREVGRLPSNIVFAQAGENLDLNVKLSISNQGAAVQTLNTLQGHPLTLSIKPDGKAQSVKGYMLLVSNRVSESAVPKVAKGKENLLALTADSFSASALPAPRSVSADTPDLLVAQFDYEQAPNGLWTAEVQSPQALGQYELRTVVSYAGQTAPDVVKMIVVVDPEGYIFRRLSDGSEARIKDATVSIYELDRATGEYILWPAREFRQENPQTTDVTGRYAFLVPPGSYYLAVDAPGFARYQSDIFPVEENKGVFMNLELKAHWWTGWITLSNALLGGILLILLYLAVIFTRRRRGRVRLAETTL